MYDGASLSVRARARRWVVTLLFAVTAALSYYAALAAPPKEELLVAFLDVGQGDAVYVRSPAGHDMLIDGGPPTGAVLRSLGEVMPASDRRIDILLATHPDADHIGGLPEVLERFDIGAVVVSGNDGDTAIADIFASAAAGEPDASVVEARRGTRIDLGGGASFEILFPDRDPSSWESNAASIVGILRYGGTSAFLSGDAPAAVERYVVGHGGALDIDVLKLGHHGSDTSTSAELLEATTPSYAIVSAGRGNRYGHPTEAVIARAIASGACVLRTDASGTIVFRSDGISFRTEAQCSDAPGPLPREGR